MPKKQTKPMSERLKEAIEQSGKTRYRIAQDTEIAESALSRFMSGERGLSMESLDRLLEYLGLEVVARKSKRQ
jgi:transcriptional regulator with XRE-family HTH domain